MHSCHAAWFAGCATTTTTLSTRSTFLINRTTDAAIIAIAREQERVVVTKDADFVESFILRREPERLLLVSTGNISNAELEQILQANLPTIEAALAQAHFVEVNRADVIIHE